MAYKTTCRILGLATAICSFYPKKAWAGAMLALMTGQEGGRPSSRISTAKPSHGLLQRHGNILVSNTKAKSGLSSDYIPQTSVGGGGIQTLCAQCHQRLETLCTGLLSKTWWHLAQGFLRTRIWITRCTIRNC